MTPPNKKILIVEDEVFMLKALGDKFRRESFTVLEAKNGSAGLATALQERPDLIILDLLMPEMDGLTMIRKLRSENTYGQKVPVIILTNLSADEKILKTVAATEPSYYLVKSNVKLSEVADKAKELLLK